MQDLTHGSIDRHLLTMAVFIGMGLVFQTLYFLVDLYFVSRLGSAAIAGVSAAGVAMFLVMGATQLIGVGAMSLTAQAIGAKDSESANLTSNQALSLSLAFGAATVAIILLAGDSALSGVSADAATADAGRVYLHAFAPALALMFPTTALGAALRAAGVVRQPMMVQTLTVVLNAALAPVLITGWLTGVPFGVAGAGWASSIAALVGMAALLLLFPRVQDVVKLSFSALTPKLKQWGRIVGVGLPAAGEFVLMFVIIGVVYWVIRHFGPHAQAGFGIGSRVMQSVFLPAMAVAFAAAPIAAQNFGAGKPERVRATFRAAALYSSAIMLVLTLVCQWRGDLLLRPFTDDPAALAVGADYLKLVSWNFVASGIVFSCSSLFQGLGDTRPSLFSSMTRLITFAAPAIWLAGQPGTSLHQIWMLSVASVWLQAGLSVLLVVRAMRVKLAGLAPAPAG